MNHGVNFQRIKMIAKFTLMTAILWYLAHCSLIRFDLLALLFHYKFLLSVTGIFFIIMVVINAWRWRLLNEAQQIKLGFLRTSLATYLGTAYNNVLPGSVGGDVVRAYYLFGKEPDKKSAVVLSVLFDRVTGLLGIFIMMGFVGLTHFSLLDEKSTLYYFFVTCILICIFVVAAFAASLVLPQQMGLSDRLQSRFSNKRWIHSLLALLEAVRIYRNARLTIIQCLFASVLIQGLMIITVMLIAKMMGLPAAGWMAYAVAIAVTQVANLIPVTPGGIGVGEAAFAKTVMLFNPYLTGPFATVFIAYRLIGMLVYLPGVIGSLFQFAMRHSKEVSYAEK